MLNKPFRILVVLFGLFGALLPLTASAAPGLNLENTIYLDLPSGRVVIQMLPNVAPRHVARIKELTRKGFYDGLAFHRVIPGFMAQTGDPQGDGSGGSGQQLKAEFSLEQHLRGTVSMARASDPNSADSQFFICFAPAPFLDRQYTVWGRVVSGMEFVDKIKAGSQYNNGAVSNPTRIVRMKVAADVKR
jgi:peptidylprolyl isomerase